MKPIHPGDSMTAEQHLQAVINLQVADRVPTAPFPYCFLAGHAGLVVHRMWSDPAFTGRPSRSASTSSAPGTAITR